MRVSWFYFTNHQGNLRSFYGQATCTSFYIFALAWNLPQKSSQIWWRSNCITTQIQNTFGNTFRRYSFNRKNTRGIINEMRYINICPSSEFRVCNKPSQKMKVLDLIIDTSQMIIDTSQPSLWQMKSCRRSYNNGRKCMGIPRRQCWS